MVSRFKITLRTFETSTLLTLPIYPEQTRTLKDVSQINVHDRFHCFCSFFSFMFRHVARRSCRSRELKDLIRQIFINSIFDSRHTVLIFVFCLSLLRVH